MPDVHGGSGATIGSVIATHQAIIPAAVGGDSGCGMAAVRTLLTAEGIDERSLKKVFDDYVAAVSWAQADARGNRDQMMALLLAALARHLPAFQSTAVVINCHHKDVEREHHHDANVWVTRKGAIRARAGDLGIIPGSMGARSDIVRGQGNRESYCSCAHGAGRRMGRTAAEKCFTVRHQSSLEGAAAVCAPPGSLRYTRTSRNIPISTNLGKRTRSSRSRRCATMAKTSWVSARKSSLKLKSQFFSQRPW